MTRLQRVSFNRCTPNNLRLNAQSVMAARQRCSTAAVKCAVGAVPKLVHSTAAVEHCCLCGNSMLEKSLLD